MVDLEVNASGQWTCHNEQPDRGHALRGRENIFGFALSAD